MENTHTHKFTESGLGQAPFTFLGIRENNFDLGDGTSKPGGTCDHCWTGIRHEFVIISADGKESVVGSSCINKSGDNGLIEIAKAEKNRKAREARWAKSELLREATLQAERDRNGGLTDWEAAEAAREAEKAAEAERKEPIIDLLWPLATHIADGRGGFCDSISRDLQKGNVPEGRGFDLTIEILAKKVGRKNSAAFKEEAARIEEILTQAKAVA